MLAYVKPRVVEDSSLETATGVGSQVVSKEKESREERPELARFLLYAEGELHFSRESLEKYASVLRQLERLLGKSPGLVDREDVYRIKARFVANKLSDNWQASTLLALKRFLIYVRDVEGGQVLDPEIIKPPKRRYREVLFLTSEEVEQFVSAVRLTSSQGRTSLRGHRFRALAEMLLGSGLRISELLSLNRGQIDPETREAKIVGKGSKERQAFFTPRALHWLDRYLAFRTDQCPALFADITGRRRMKRSDVWRFFAHTRKRAGITKKVTPHILRHTAATQLLFNGCPIAHIKEILGHSRLETTCRYYLGVDHRAAKAAHEKYLIYSDQPA